MKIKLLLGPLHKYALLFAQKAFAYAEMAWKWLDFLTAKIFALSDHTSLRTPRIFFRALIVFLLTFIVWANFFKIDQVVHAQGQIIANARSQIVQAADGGVIVELKVQEGDTVQAGEIIAVLEKDRAQASFSESQGKVMALRLTISRLNAEIHDRPLSLDKNIQRK